MANKTLLCHGNGLRSSKINWNNSKISSEKSKRITKYFKDSCNKQKKLNFFRDNMTFLQ